MVEYKQGIYDDTDYFRPEEPPPLVQAHHAPIDFSDLHPITVSVVSDEDLCQEAASVVSTESSCVHAEDNTNNLSGQNQEKGGGEKVAWSAGLAGGVVGTLVGGPVLGIVAGGASAYYSKKEGAAGDISRAIGEIGSASYLKAKELNQKHHLLDKSRKAASSAWTKAKELNKKNHILDKSKVVTKKALSRAKKFDEKHHVVKSFASFVLLCIKELIKIAEQVGGRLQEGETTEQLAKECIAEADATVSGTDVALY